MKPEPRTPPPSDAPVDHCPRCDHLLKGRSNFCPNCGMALPSLRSVGVDRSSLRAF